MFYQPPALSDSDLSQSHLWVGAIATYRQIHPLQSVAIAPSQRSLTLSRYRSKPVAIDVVRYRSKPEAFDTGRYRSMPEDREETVLPDTGLAEVVAQ